MHVSPHQPRNMPRRRRRKRFNPITNHQNTVGPQLLELFRQSRNRLPRRRRYRPRPRAPCFHATVASNFPIVRTVLPCSADKCIPVAMICNRNFGSPRIAKSVDRINPNSARVPVTKQTRRWTGLRGIGQHIPLQKHSPPHLPNNLPPHRRSKIRRRNPNPRPLHNQILLRNFLPRSAYPEPPPNSADSLAEHPARSPKPVCQEDLATFPPPESAAHTPQIVSHPH